MHYGPAEQGPGRGLRARYYGDCVRHRAQQGLHGLGARLVVLPKISADELTRRAEPGHGHGELLVQVASADVLWTRKGTDQDETKNITDQLITTGSLLKRKS